MKSQDSDIICRNCNEAISDDELNATRKIKNEYSGDKLSTSIVHLYQNLLDRFLDKDGFNFFYSKISNKELTIQEVEKAIKQSHEYAFLHPPNLSLKHFS